MGENRAPDMVGYHGLDRSENPLAARIAELEAHCVRLGQGDAERYWEARYRDEAAENAHLHAEIARKDEALKGARETILDLKNARWSEAEGTDAEWVAEIDAALSNATTPETGGDAA